MKYLKRVYKIFYYIAHPLRACDYLLRLIIRKMISHMYFVDIVDYYKNYQFQSIKDSFKQIGENSYIHYPWNSIHGSKYIVIGKYFHANKGLYIGGYGEDNNHEQIIIGDNVVIGFDCQITAIKKVKIGNNVLMGSRIFISDHSHGKIDYPDITEIPIKRMLFSKGPVIIGNNVWIGSGVAILPNVTIGDNCIIGANSVITKSFPANHVLAGNPARIIKIIDLK